MTKSDISAKTVILVVLSVKVVKVTKTVVFIIYFCPESTTRAGDSGKHGYLSVKHCKTPLLPEMAVLPPV